MFEKFKGFRQGFRTFDKNFDGSLSFAEFIAGMNEMGVHLSVVDFRLLFE
jgi:Ca2+-binding EF-hand superfamily protein